MAKIVRQTQRVDYDQIALLYDEPGRDYKVDPYLVEYLIARKYTTSTKFRALDMGCGTGKQLTANIGKYPGIEMIGIDLFSGMLKIANNRGPSINWIQGNNLYTSFDNDSIDYITNQFSYHHVLNKKILMNEVFRILKPGGRFVITNLEPWSMPGWIVYSCFPASRERDFTDFLNIDELSDLMKITGFNNIKVKYQYNRNKEKLGDFFNYASQRHRTSQLMAISDCDYAEGIANLKNSITELGRDFKVDSEICLVWIKGDKPI